VRTRQHRSFRTLIAGSLIAGSVALITPGSPVQAASVTVTVVDENGDPIERAMVAVLDGDGAALAGAIADENGEVDIDDGSGSGVGYVVAAPGYETVRTLGTLTNGASLTLTAADGIGLTYSNAYGAQVSGVFADGEPGVFYITTDGIPSVWRTLDHGGTWAPVPTTAYSEDGLPQSGAGGLVTSGYPGEVAVVVENAVWYSRDFGTTWDSIAYPTGVNLQNPEVRWAHSVDGTDEASVLMLAAGGWTGTTAYLADMTEENPALGSLSVSGLLALGAADGKVFLYRAAAGSPVEFAQVSVSGSTWSLGSGTPIANLQLTAGADDKDSLVVRTLSGSATTPDAVLLYEHTSSGSAHRGVMKIAFGGSVASTATELVGQRGNNDNPFAANWQQLTGIDNGPNNGGTANYCGENGTGTAVSIGPVPSGDFNGFALVGTVGSCMWAYNPGSAIDWPSATSGTAEVGNGAGSGEIGIVYLDGINNNTGFAWSGGYDFSTDMVALAPNEFGVAKASDIGGFRPNFSRAPRDRNGIVNALARPGAADDTSGVSIKGLTAAVVRDIAMDPNDPTGDTYAMIAAPSGGSRVMLTTDGGESFSTLAGSGGETMAWWNGADGVEYMAYYAGLNNALMIKPFTRETGTGAAQMGDELAKTGAERETDINGFAFVGNGLQPPAPINGQSNYLGALASGNAQLSAMAGVTGTDLLLVGGSAIQSGGGSVDATYSSGSVALMSLAVDSSNVPSVSSMKVYGENRSATGDAPSSGDTRGSYTNGGVTSITYCPVGSAADVADKAFITVKGTTSTATSNGLYVLTGVSGGSPTHSEIAAVATLGLADLKIDCASGLIVGVVPGSQGNPPTPGGVYLSTDAATFVQVSLTVRPTAADIVADEATGEVTMVVAGGNGDVTSVEMTEDNLGIDLTEVKAGTEPTPGQPIQPPADGVTPINDSANGINTGGVAEIELPPSEDDAELAGSVGAASVRRRAVRALAGDTPISVGSASGAFSASVGAAASGGGGTTFEPLTPARILDTRSGVGATAGKVGKIDGTGAALELAVAGKGGLPASGIGAVALNVTVVEGQANDFGGYVTVYPCGTRPDASNLNFVSGQTIPNSVIAPVSATGTVCFYVYGSAHLLADVSGYLPSGFTPLTPARILDTRSGVGATAGKVGKIDGTGAALELAVAGKGGLPASGLDAVALNVTVVEGQANDFGGFVTVYPCGTRPDASNLNFVSGQTIPNSVIAPVSATGTVCFYVYGSAHLLADVSGYFASGFSQLTPARILDTRSGVGATAGKVGKIDGTGAALELTVAGKGSVPVTGVSAVALNVTVVEGQANDFGGYVTVYPCGTRPDASNLNFVSGQTIPNSVIAPVSADGKVCFYVYGSAHLLADVSGYFGS
jgi:hypothetical protein